MTTNRTYAEKLKDPRWQRKRLEIMERDEFTCQSCYSKESTLNVHHKLYLKGRNPWEYDNDDLITLCQDCHKSQEKNRAFVLRVLGDQYLGDVLVRICTTLRSQNEFYPPMGGFLLALAVAFDGRDEAQEITTGQAASLAKMLREWMPNLERRILNLEAVADLMANSGTRQIIGGKQEEEQKS